MKALQGSFFAASTEFGKPENRKNPKLWGLNTQPLPNQNKYLISKPWKNTTHKEGIHGLYTLPETNSSPPLESYPKPK